MKKILPAILLFAFLISPSITVAADLTVRPFLIDRNVEAREFLSEEVSLTNNANRRLNIYATVNEITVDGAGEIKEFVSPIMTDRTNTVTSWVEITRGRIEIEPGETKNVPLGFRIHPNAEPGEYHVFIGFGSASKRYQAESAAMKGEVDGVIVKLTIADESTEYLRIAGFLIDRFITSADNRKVQIDLENLGDVPATPQGEIIFFNSNGIELDAIPFNNEDLVVPPGETVTVTSEIPFGNELGRFKANLALHYGERQRATLSDSTQFFMMPWHILLLMLLLAIAVAFIIFLMLHKAIAYDNGDEEGAELPFIVRDGHDAKPKDHDIDLSTDK